MKVKIILILFLFCTSLYSQEDVNTDKNETNVTKPLDDDKELRDNQEKTLTEAIEIINKVLDKISIAKEWANVKVYDNINRKPVLITELSEVRFRIFVILEYERTSRSLNDFKNSIKDKDNLFTNKLSAEQKKFFEKEYQKCVDKAKSLRVDYIKKFIKDIDKMKDDELSKEEMQMLKKDLEKLIKSEK